MGASNAESIRNRALVAGVLGGFLGRSISLVAPFIVMPAMLSYLGESVFGVWLIAVSVTSMALFVDLGIGNGLLTRLSRAIGDGDYIGIRAYIASAYITLSVVSVILLALLGLAFLSVKTGVVGGLDSFGGEAIAVFFVCLLGFIVGVPASVINRVMYATQRAWISNVWQVVAAILSVVFCLVSIKLQTPPWLVVASYSLPPVVVMCVSAIHFFSFHPEMMPRASDYSKRYSIDLLVMGARFLALGVVTSVALNADSLIIAQRLGAEAVTNYAVPAKLASLLGLIVTIIFLPLWPANGEAIARRDYAWVKRTTVKMSLYGGIAVAMVGIVLTALSPEIINFWMHREFESQQKTIFFLSLLSAFMAATSPFNMVLNALGFVRPQLVAWILFLILTLPLKYWALGYGNVWIVPMIGAFGYLLAVSLVIYAYVWRRVFSGSMRQAENDLEIVGDK